MTRAVAPEEIGSLFAKPYRWIDMDAWHAQMQKVRRDTPVLRVELPGYEPFWALTRHEDVLAVSRDSELFVNTARSVLGLNSEWERLATSGLPLPATLVHLDGQAHKDHRHITSDWFKPAVVGRRQPRIDELADMFMARMRDIGEACDFAQDIAKPYTLRVIMEIYGVPEEDESLMLELTQGIFGAADPEFIGGAGDAAQRVIDSIMSFVQYFGDITADRQACPRDDLASIIANGQIDGCPLGEQERLWYYIIVATAGHDTTSFALAGGMEALLQDTSQLWALRDDPDLIVNATDEVIRWTSPVRHFLRYATRDTSIRGVGIPAGDRVLLSYPSANRDEDVFADSMTFDIRRADADKLLSFGVGAHFCLGAQFARREIRTMLGRLSRELEHIELAGEPSWAQSHFVSGVKHLPVRYRFK
jgi:cytochrome P450